MLRLSRRALEAATTGLRNHENEKSQIRFSPANYLINYRQFTLKFIYATSTNARSRDTMRRKSCLATLNYDKMIRILESLSALFACYSIRKRHGIQM